jgi:hypothetical protein
MPDEMVTNLGDAGPPLTLDRGFPSRLVVNPGADVAAQHQRAAITALKGRQSPFDSRYGAVVTVTLAKNKFQAVLGNVESLLLSEIDRAKLSVPTRYFAPIALKRRWRLAQSSDRNFARHMSESWVCSEDDRARLSQIASRQTPIVVIPNPVPGWCAELGRDDPERFTSPAPKALFVGHLRYRPIVVAVRRLAGTI